MKWPKHLPRLTAQQTAKWYTEHLTAALAKSQEHYRQARRWLARNDLYYLMVAVLHRRDMVHDWLFQRCREVQAEPDDHLDLWAREHYKSSIITFGLTIQDILVDPETTAGIFSHTRPISKGFLRQIKREFEANEDLIGLFPEIFWENPHRDAPKWSEDDGIIVKRAGNPKEATVEAWGLVDGMPTGKHFGLLVFDDVVTEKSVTTPEMIRKTTDAWSLSLNLGAEGGRRRVIGTRYHFNDTYRTMIERVAVAPRVYPATTDGKVDGPPVLLSRDVLAQKRRDQGPYIFGCQMLQDPRADKSQGFDEEWLAYWPAVNLDRMNIYIIVDPANKKRKNSDYTAIVVLGLGDDNVYRVITWIRDRLNLTERTNALFALVRQYEPKHVGYEEYGMQADIEHIEERMARDNYRFKIIALGGNQIVKEDRIRRLVPLFEQGRILLPETCPRRNYEGRNEDLTKVFVNEEYLAFPVAGHDDMLDGLSRIEDEDMIMVKPGVSGAVMAVDAGSDTYDPLRH